MKIKAKVERSVKSNRQAPKFSCCEWLLIMLTWTVVIVFFPLSLLLTIKLAPQYERAVVFRLGKLRKDAGTSGLFCVLPCTDEFRRIDMRTRMFDVPPQEVLTRDSVTVKVEAVIYYRVTDACMAVGNIERCDITTRLLAQTSLRNIMGTRTLTEILTDRDDVSRDVIAILDDVTDVWGVKVCQLSTCCDNSTHAPFASCLKVAHDKTIFCYNALLLHVRCSESLLSILGRWFEKFFCRDIVKSIKQWFVFF